MPGRTIAVFIFCALVLPAFCDSDDQALAYLNSFSDPRDLSTADHTRLMQAIGALADDSFATREKAAHTITAYQLQALPLIAELRERQPLDTGLRLDVLSGQIKANMRGLPARLVEHLDRLVKAGDTRMTPRLIQLIEHDEESIRHHAVHALRRVSGQQFGYGASHSKTLREMAVRRWQEWWNRNRDDFIIQGGTEDYYLLVSVASRCKLLRKDGHVIWDIELGNTVSDIEVVDDQCLALTSVSDHSLHLIQRGWVTNWTWTAKSAAKTRLNSVTHDPQKDTLMVGLKSPLRAIAELDRSGEMQWTHANQNACVSDARALANGHVLLADPIKGRIREINRHGITVWEFHVGAQRAELLSNGNILTNTGRTLIEVDRSKRTAWSVELAAVPRDFTRLPDGLTAVFIPGTGLVLIDQDGHQTILHGEPDVAKEGTVTVAPPSYLTFPDPD